MRDDSEPAYEDILDICPNDCQSDPAHILYQAAGDVTDKIEVYKSI